MRSCRTSGCLSGGRRTPSWVEELQAENVRRISERFAPGRSLAEDFKSRFNLPLDEEVLNDSHQIVIVAESLDDSSERIVKYLSERGISINVLCFQVFGHEGGQLLSRTWLVDPTEAQINAAQPDRAREPWNGEFYGSFGHDKHCHWEDARELGFISAGGGAWYSRTLEFVGPGDRVWVKVPGYGFVGVGRVKGRVQPISEFKVGDRPIREVATRSGFHQEFDQDPERCEYFVPVDWLETVPLEQGIKEVGLFGNQNSICKPTTPKWRSTVERLKQHFRKADP